MNFRLASTLLVTLGLGCAHSSLQASDLEQIHRPALVSRLTDDAGPQVNVYRADPARAGALKATTPEAADQRLQEKLAGSVTRFEVGERLRTRVQSSLQREKPWSQAVPPAQVAGVLETFLVQDVTATPPDYAKLKPLGADAVVEFLIDCYGLRSEKGVPQSWVRGTGRMFRLSDGGEIWRSGFTRTSADANLAPLDPAALVDDPQPFRSRWPWCSMGGIALAQQLNTSGAPLDLQPPTDVRPTRGPGPKPKPAAPPPDATAPTESPVDPNAKKKAPAVGAPARRHRPHRGSGGSKEEVSPGAVGRRRSPAWRGSGSIARVSLPCPDTTPSRSTVPPAASRFARRWPSRWSRRRRSTSSASAPPVPRRASGRDIWRWCAPRKPSAAPRAGPQPARRSSGSSPRR